MRKNIIIISVIILSMILGGVIGYMIINNSPNNYRPELNMENKKILAVMSYSNYAWGVTFNGKAIFNDGSIYSWNFNGTVKEFGNYDVASYDDIKSYIAKNGKKSKEKLSNNELDKMEGYIKRLNDLIDLKCMGADQGVSLIYVWSGDKKIKLSSSGDCNGENVTYNGKRLLSLINKYLKE